ncbi:hypothetical protein [Blastococcus capsensis]|nr:hypothetical protein [Blastococcus capsensis]MDK3254938.1 hypothetical protein [Blastococcus capsensis]
MTARTIDGTAVARKVREDVADGGPMTIAMLLANTLVAARAQQGIGN